MSEKVSFQVISRNIVSVMLAPVQLTSSVEYLTARDIFQDKMFPRKFSVVLSDEGKKIPIEIKEHGVIATVQDESIIKDTIVSFTDQLSDDTHRSYKIDYDKARKVLDYWKAICPVFPHKISPILSKSKPGYCYHRLDFDAAEAETPTFDHLVGNFEDNKEAFMAFIGALFDSEKTPQQYLWLYGQGQDGKGSLERLLARIFNQSYQAVQTDERYLDKYWQSNFLDKRLGVCGDTRNLNFVNSSIFMQVTGGDHVTVRPMYKPAYTTKLNTMFILMANAEPMITSENSSQRRAIVCHLKPQFEDDKNFIENFEEKLWAERAGIVWKCWQEWKKVKDLVRIPVNKKSLADRSKDNEEMLQQLVDRYFEIRKGAKIKASDAITILKENEKRPPDDKTLGVFKRFLKRVYGVEVAQIEGDDGIRARYYMGICAKGTTLDEDTKY